ncbi:hypothetical protein [Dyadobacter sp. NIV53]|uniref:hypothetical protein n=1 Tax=Dyadobacter sp. NIV53 TaxID=2861765 RepID=UPI001C884D4D|nr:hypothetical protein [Dyadobacter sp. NIV53]
MKHLRSNIAGLLLISGTTFAQIITQPVQQPASGQSQVAPAGQVNQVRTGQTTRTVTQQQVNTTPAQTQVPVATDGQTTVISSQNATPVVNGEVQPATTVQEIESVQQQSLPVNTGQVPKVYTNTTDALPFRDRQPKPTGRISPANMPVRRPNR